MKQPFEIPQPSVTPELDGEVLVIAAAGLVDEVNGLVDEADGVVDEANEVVDEVEFVENSPRSTSVSEGCLCKWYNMLPITNGLRVI